MSVVQRKKTVISSLSSFEIEDDTLSFSELRSDHNTTVIVSKSELYGNENNSNAKPLDSTEFSTRNANRLRRSFCKGCCFFTATITIVAATTYLFAPIDIHYQLGLYVS